MKKNNKSNISKVIVLVVALIILGVSVTYAYFTAQISGKPTQTTIKAGTLKIETNLESVGSINNTQMKLIDAANKETEAESVSFYVKNSSESTVTAKYYIYLKDIAISKNLYSTYFKWELLQNGNVVGSGTFADTVRKDTPNTGEAANIITTAEDMTLNKDAISLITNKSDSLEFRVWLENDANVNQIDLANANFEGKLYLEAVPGTKNQ